MPLRAPGLEVFKSRLQALTVAPVSPDLKLQQKQLETAANHPQGHSQIYHVHAAPFEAARMDGVQFEDGAWGLQCFLINDRKFGT